jgi:hypothetical protein
MDLVESEIFYIALFCEKTDVTFQPELLERRSSVLTQILPDAQKYSETVFVYEFRETTLSLVADVFNQKLVCYFNPSASNQT